MARDLPIAQCNLDLPGLRAQRERYADLGASVQAAERTAGRLTVRFGPDLDETLLQETIAIERECCPFFLLDYDTKARELAVGVRDAEQEPALDAIASALGR